MPPKRASAVNGSAARNNAPRRIMKEQQILQQAVGRDTDNWPLYILEDATVYGKDKRTFASLLHAELEGPFTIRGTLVLEKANKKHCR